MRGDWQDAAMTVERIHGGTCRALRAVFSPGLELSGDGRLRG